MALTIPVGSEVRSYQTDPGGLITGAFSVLSGGFPPFVQNAPVLAVVGTRSIVPQDSSAVTGATGSIDVHEDVMNFTTANAATTNLRAVYFAGYDQNAQGGYQPLAFSPTIKCAFGTGTTTKTNLFAGGVEGRVYAPGEVYATDIGVVASDLGIGSIGAAATLTVRTGVPLANGQTLYGGNATSVSTATKKDSSLSGLLATTADQVPGVGDMSTTGRSTTPVYGFTPIAIIGNFVSTRTRSVLCLGDSIAQGTGEPTAASQTGVGNFNGGFMARGLYDASATGKPDPWSKMTRPGGAAFSFLFNTAPVQAILPYFTDCLCNYGYNDANAGARSAVQIVADLITIGRLVNSFGVRFHWCTMVPSASSTDTYLTLAYQTVNAAYAAKAAAVKVGMVAAYALGYGAGGITGTMVDYDSVLRDPVQTDKWVVDGVTANYAAAADGVHPAGRSSGVSGHSLMAGVVKAVIQAQSIP